MPYAVVQDVPASWEQYEELAAHLLERIPDGLIYHVAGPTDEGYRTIEVWETKAAWERFRGLCEAACRSMLWAAPVLRELTAATAICGSALAGPAPPTRTMEAP